MEQQLIILGLKKVKYRAMEIRKTTSQDNFNDISKIYTTSWKHAFHNLVPQTFLDEMSETQLADTLQTSSWEQFVVVSNEKYIATSTICPARDIEMGGWGEVLSIHVLPAYWGKGVGKLLLNAGIEELRKTGFKNVYLWTFEENVRARRFYEKYGFINSNDKKTSNIGGKDLVECKYVLSPNL